MHDNWDKVCSDYSIHYSYCLHLHDATAILKAYPTRLDLVRNMYSGHQDIHYQGVASLIVWLICYTDKTPPKGLLERTILVRTSLYALIHSAKLIVTRTRPRIIPQWSQPRRAIIIIPRISITVSASLMSRLYIVINHSVPTAKSTPPIAAVKAIAQIIATCFQ